MKGMVHMLKKRNLFKKLGFLCLATVVTLASTSTGVFAYTAKQLKTSKATSEIVTGNKIAGDYFKLTTEGSKIMVTYKHQAEYRSGFSPRLVAYPLPSNYIRQDTVLGTKYVTGIDGLEAGGTASFSYNCSYIPDGSYYFRICENNRADRYPALFPGVKVVVKSGKPTLHKFSNISAANKKLAGTVSYKKATTKSLSDYKYQLFKKKGSDATRNISATAEANYYKKVSNKIVNNAGAKTNYEKAFAIYQYVAENFYYDNNAVATGRTAYDDPYYNLKYQQTKTGNSYNAFKGKVALHCDGYAGIFTALARAQGIPTRMIYGKKIVQGRTSWEVESAADLNKRTHTWVQCYINKRWVNIDPQQASSNTYGARDSKSNKTWTKVSTIKNYYFDISYDQFAATHKFIKFAG